MRPSPFSHHLQPEWKENLKKVKSQQEPESDSFTLERELKWWREIMKAKVTKERKEGSDYFMLNFSRPWSQVISYISVSSPPCLSFCPCSSVKLPQFLLDPLLAVSNPQGTFCQIRIDKAHCWSICTLIHFFFPPSRLCWPVPSPGARKEWHRSYSDT